MNTVRWRTSRVAPGAVALVVLALMAAGCGSDPSDAAAAASAPPASTTTPVNSADPTLPGSKTDGSPQPGGAQDPSTGELGPDGATPGGTQPPGSEACLYTDPGRVDISVLQARMCPDGTTVSVHGKVVVDGDDTWLCDTSAATDAASCSAAGLRLVGTVPASGRPFAGVVIAGELHLAP